MMAEQYDKTCCQGKRSDIIRELEILAGNETESTYGHNGHKLKSRDVLAREYGFSSRNAARYLRLNYLIRPFKDMYGQERDPASFGGGYVLYTEDGGAAQESIRGSG